jgi:hypothetical protein
MVRRQQLPWMRNAGHQIITTLCGAGTERIRAEMRQVIEDEGLSDYESIYTDGSLKDEKVYCAVILPTAALKYRLLPQTTIFNAKMFAILKATKHSKPEKSVSGQKPYDLENTQPVGRGRGGLETNVGTCTHWNQG